MKKLFLVLVFGLIQVLAQAQGNEFYNFNGKFNKGFQPKTDYKVAISYDSTFTRKGKLKLAEFNQFNQLGKLTYRNTKNGKQQTFYTYFRDTIFKSGVTLWKGDTAGLWMYDFNEQGKIVKYKYAYKSIQKVRWSQTTIYDSKMRGIKYENRNQKNKLTGYTEVSYNDSGTLADRRYYNKNGKLKSVYSYACDAKGEQLKNVKSVNYCRSKGAHNDGRFYETIETIRKGKAARQVYTYSADSLLLSYEFTDIKGKPKGKTLYFYNEQQMCSKIEFYNAKGKLKSYNTSSYNNRGYMAEFRRFKANGKLALTQKSSYIWHN